jgi:hypothetical protein
MEETDREVLGSRDPASSLRGRTMAESAVNPRLPDHFTSLNVCLIGLIPTFMQRAAKDQESFIDSDSGRQI